MRSFVGTTPAGLYTVLVSALLAPAIAGSQSLDYTALEQLFGEPVTSSVTGSPQRSSDVAATMSIITADDIRRSGARDIPGVLRHVVGVQHLQTSNDHTDVSARGYNQAFSPRLLVLVDGRQVYADYYGFTPWSTVPVELDAIRQIEVVKGPNSALFGFNAVGGVINIVTYGPLDEEVDTASLSAGTQDLKKASVVSTWRFAESAGIRLSAGHRDGDDFSTPLHPADVGVRRGNERNAVNLSLEWDAGQQRTFGAEATYSNARQSEQLPVYLMTHDEYETTSIKGYMTADTRFGLLEATAYSNQMRMDSFMSASPVPWLMLDNRVSVAQLQSISKLANKHTMRLSAEYRHNTMETTPVPGGDVFYDVAAIGGMWEWRLVPSLTLTTALRLDRWSLGRSGSVPAGYGLENDGWNRAESDPTFNAGVVWQASDVDTVRFLLGRGVQLPNLLNLGGLVFPVPPLGFASGVPDLEPTVVENFEISWDRTLSAFPAQLRVSAFRGRSRDMVALLGGMRPLQRLVNVPFNLGDSQTHGVEVSLDGALYAEWRWGLSYRGQDIDDEFDPGFSVETTLADFEHTTPRHVVKARLGWARDRWETDLYFHYQSGFSGITVGPLGLGSGLLIPVSSYVSLDGRLSYAISDRVVVAVSGQNLGSARQRQSSAPEVERTLFATFSMSFGSVE
ncbi:MAG: TonB-dependent receptor [Woeseia sp.]